MKERVLVKTASTPAGLKCDDTTCDAGMLSTDLLCDDPATCRASRSPASCVSPRLGLAV